jgi:hypothetical protein
VPAKSFIFFLLFRPIPDIIPQNIREIGSFATMGFAHMVCLPEETDYGKASRKIYT